MDLVSMYKIGSANTGRCTNECSYKQLRVCRLVNFIFDRYQQMSNKNL